VAPDVMFADDVVLKIPVEANKTGRVVRVQQRQYKNIQEDIKKLIGGDVLLCSEDEGFYIVRV